PRRRRPRTVAWHEWHWHRHRAGSASWAQAISWACPRANPVDTKPTNNVVRVAETAGCKWHDRLATLQPDSRHPQDEGPSQEPFGQRASSCLSTYSRETYDNIIKSRCSIRGVDRSSRDLGTRCATPHRVP